MDPRILAILSDPEFIENAVRAGQERMRIEREAREAFSRTPIFTRLLETLRDAPTALGFNTEELIYFSKQVQVRLGWEFATVEEINQFVDVLADSRASTVDESSRTVDPECWFDNEELRHFGLVVSRMSGQGTIIGIRNDRSVNPS